MTIMAMQRTNSRMGAIGLNGDEVENFKVTLWVEYLVLSSDSSQMYSLKRQPQLKDTHLTLTGEKTWELELRSSSWQRILCWWSCYVSSNPTFCSYLILIQRVCHCIPLIHDVAEGGESEQDVASHSQDGQLGQHLESTYHGEENIH